MLSLCLSQFFLILNFLFLQIHSAQVPIDSLLLTSGSIASALITKGTNFHNEVGSMHSINDTTKQSLCPTSSSTSLTSNVSDSSYQWHVFNNGSFINITDNSYYNNTNSATLQINNITSSWSGKQYRCITSRYISRVFEINFSNVWTNALDNVWENPGNWSCKSIPDSNTAVIIDSGTAIMNSNVTIRSLTINPTATINIKSGNQLTIVKTPVTETKNFLAKHFLAFYPFSGNAQDESGNNYNLSVNGATPTQDRFGNENKAYAFNGTNQYLTIPNFTRDTSHNSFTISLWAKPEQTRTGFILSLQSDNNINCVNSLWIDNNPAEYNIRSNFVSSFQPRDNCTAQLAYKTIPNANGKWIHVVMVVEAPNRFSRNWYLYVNGQRTSAGSSNLKPSTFKNGGIIGRAIYNADFYKGVIDDIRIYDKALSSNEVIELLQLQK